MTTMTAGLPGARRLLVGVVATAAMLALVLALVAAPARAEFGVTPGTFTAGAVDSSGQIYTQAGGHPYAAATSFAFNSHDVGSGFLMKTLPDEDIKDVIVDLPAGFVGNPAATPRCNQALVIGSRCPPATQVGVTDVKVQYLVGRMVFTTPVYNIDPLPGDPADFAFNISGTTVVVRAKVRTGSDYGITTITPNISEYLPVLSVKLTFWGVPGDASHDVQRGQNCTDYGFGPNCWGGNQPSGSPPVPFLTNPVDCSAGPVQTRLRIDSWQHPGVWQEYTADSPAVTGCDQLAFQPSLTARPQSSVAGAPSGYAVDLKVPQPYAPDALATSSLRKASVALPVGVRVSPSAADGLAACSLVQIGLKSTAEPACPDASSIGSVAIDTPLLADPLQGHVYLAAQNDNPFHSLLAIYLVAQGSGVTVKLAGEVDTDPNTGQLTATFDDNPQLPFSALRLRFDGGSRAPLVNPAGCGSYATRSVFGSWSAPFTPDVVSNDVMTIDQGCDRAGRFEPSVAAGVVSPQAGASSPFVMSFSRPDGQQELGAINGSLPPGLLGVLKSVPLCSAAQGAAGTCSPASRVGKVQVAAGAGSTPVWLPVAGQPEDSVFLTEPYRKGDVAGMSIVVPAVAGPFNLGRVVTKVYLKLRPQDQGIDLQSDRLPRILDGIPLNIRQVVVTIDRKGFMVNPTSCEPMAVYTNVFSQSWAKVPVSSRFQVGGCASLPVSPVITVAGGGKGNTKRYEHPALRVSIRQSSDQAHLSKTNVVLPRPFNVDLKAPTLKASCPRVVYAKDQCSPVATIGTVKAVTPLLREPLTGPAFLLQKKGELPDIVMRLRNNRMSLDLIGVLDFLKDGRLITRVKGIPDAALSSFVLQIKGGKNGSLLNRSDLCARKRLTKVTFKGQNGKISRKSPVTRISGCASKQSATRAASRRAARSASARASAAQIAGARVSAARGAHAAQVHQRAVGGRS